MRVQILDEQLLMQYIIIHAISSYVLCCTYERVVQYGHVGQSGQVPVLANLRVTKKLIFGQQLYLTTKQADFETGQYYFLNFEIIIVLFFFCIYDLTI